MSAQKCPVCDGRGTVPSSFYNPAPPGVVRQSTTFPMRTTCRGCNGDGVVWPPTPRFSLGHPYGALTGTTWAGVQR